jgi:hypothetical protein
MLSSCAAGDALLDNLCPFLPLPHSVLPPKKWDMGCADLLPFVTFAISSFFDVPTTSFGVDEKTLFE